MLILNFFVQPELETLKKSQNKEFYFMKLLFLNMSDALKRTGTSLVFFKYQRQERGQILMIPEAKFLDVIGKKVLRFFLLAIHSYLY